MAQPKLELRSPLKDKTLRNPGQSIDDEIRKLADRFEEDALAVLLLVFLLFVELVQWLLNAPAYVIVVVTAVLLLFALIFYIPRMVRGHKEVRRLKRARDGERAVAECLDLLRDDGHRVFHDIVGPNFNVDHVVIGPKGVFTVETKTLNKRVGQDVSLRFNGKTVFVGDAALPDNPVPQALGQASWLRQTLTDSTGKTFGVRPVIVFPGWFVDPFTGKQSDHWVLNPKVLKGKLGELPNCLSATEIQLLAFHLKRYIRATNT